jgi:hypothetical protein
MVPCDPVGYLEKEYGPKRWRSPQSKNYVWDNVKYWRNWTDDEWIRSVRYYDRKGQLIKNKTVDQLNKYLVNKISMAEFDSLVK